MATAQNVLDNSLVRFMDPDKTTWGDTELLSMLQKGVDYINQLLINRNDISATKSGQIVLTSGTSTYALPSHSMSDFLAMYGGSKSGETGVWIDDAFLDPCRETEKVALVDADNAEPTKYYLKGTTIGFLNTPNATYTVDCLYFYKQSTLALETSMPFNDIFNEALSKFVTSLANARTSNDVSNIMQLYNELERQALGVISVQTPIRPRMKLRIR